MLKHMQPGKYKILRALWIFILGWFKCKIDYVSREPKLNNIGKDNDRNSKIKFYTNIQFMDRV